jgi:tetratricopeptide (TPR) repeat protein
MVSLSRSKGARMSTSLKTSAACFLVMLALGSGLSLAQSPKNSRLISSDRSEPPRNITPPQSVIDTRLASDQIETARIDDVYQAVVKIHLRGDFQAAAEMYQSVVIPMAEKSPSAVTKNRFLFLGYRGLGNCYLGMSRFTDAEETFEQLFQYLQPGLQDSDYAMNFESIAMARIGEQRWKGAEESLQKAVSILEDQIAGASTSGLDAAQSQRANKLRISQDMALHLFAVVYFREQRYPEALEALDRAYRQAMTFGAPSEMVDEIVSDGRAVSIAAADEDAIATWSERLAERPATQ